MSFLAVSCESSSNKIERRKPTGSRSIPISSPGFYHSDLQTLRLPVSARAMAGPVLSHLSLKAMCNFWEPKRV